MAAHMWPARTGAVVLTFPVTEDDGTRPAIDTPEQSIPGRPWLAIRHLPCCFCAGLDYKRALFGPCTAPGVPAETCRVLYTEDLEADDGLLDEADTEATSPHGTNVAGIIASKCQDCCALGVRM